MILIDYCCGTKRFEVDFQAYRDTVLVTMIPAYVEQVIEV